MLFAIRHCSSWWLFVSEWMSFIRITFRVSGQISFLLQFLYYIHIAYLLLSFHLLQFIMQYYLCVIYSLSFVLWLLICRWAIPNKLYRYKCAFEPSVFGSYIEIFSCTWESASKTYSTVHMRVRVTPFVFSKEFPQIRSVCSVHALALSRYCPYNYSRIMTGLYQQAIQRINFRISVSPLSFRDFNVASSFTIIGVRSHN